MKPAVARHMTLREAVRALGMPTDAASIRRLRRRLVGIERNTGNSIFIRSAGKQRVRLLVTLRTLRRAVPEMFEDRDEEAARRRTDKAIQLISDALDEVRESNAILHSRLERLARDLHAHVAQHQVQVRRAG